jgi:RimJ/RimL family protein N-acetyltransferase/uncharacterized damage-inducible protein DinB
VFAELLTRRLALRQLYLSDVGAMFDYRSGPDVARFQTWEPQSQEQVRSFIASFLDLEPDTPGAWFQLAITLRESGLLIGDCGLHFPVGETRQAEVGITLSPAYQGQGYATEALRAVLDYLFITLGKHRVYATVDPRNLPSVALLKRVGLRQEAHLRESLWFKGAWADDLVFAILDREWIAQQGRQEMNAFMNRDGLLALYVYNAYANKLVLNIVEQLAEAKFTRESSPSHGSVRTLLLHMLECEAFFLACCQGQPFREFDLADFSTVADIRRRWTELEQEQQAFIASLNESDVVREISAPLGERPLYFPLWQLLVQAFVHSTHHRGELSVVLTQLGHPLPTLDIILHFIQQSGQE